MSTTTSDRQLVTIVLAILAVVLLAPLLFWGFGMMGVGPMMGSGGHGMWGDGAAPTWVVVGSFAVQILFLAVVVGAAYLIYRAIAARGAGRDPAIEELRRAFARGDLTEEEFESRRETLEDDR